MMINNTLDEIDKQIIQLLQKDPTMTHSSIAVKLNRSQPAIGARIKKLVDTGILSTQVGVDFKLVSDLNLMKIELMSSKPQEIFEMATVCPYVINAMKISGEYNILIFLACSNLKRIDLIVNRHFRNKEYINRIRMDLVTNFALPFILPLDFSIDNFACADEKCTNCVKCRQIHDTEKTKAFSKTQAESEIKSINQ